MDVGCEEEEDGLDDSQLSNSKPGRSCLGVREGDDEFQM